MNIGKRLCKISWFKLIEALIMLVFSCLLIRCFPFRWWSGWLGTRSQGEVTAIDPVRDHRVGDVARTLNAINRRCGGRFTCLMLAMAAHWMLGRRGISSSLVLGTRTEIADDQSLVMHAHAWLRVGPRVVLGAHDGSYVAVSSFVRGHPSTAERTKLP
ncbi:lasso peptide biosynthesis B2 protein [Halomonas pantelleriensis]|uniref:lasso peptide biosynthesis B2 protein n=1 Tax=Franzmannia pantelleriensis TaxID=48727 RepID=UPI000B7D4E32